MRSSTAVIIGGGVIGLSAAYHLARKRFGRVIVVEKGRLGDGSSSRAAGIITGLLWSETGVVARRKSLALFRELSDDLEGYTFHEVGCLNLFDPQSWPERERLLPLYERTGTPFEILDAGAIRRRWPCLTPRDDVIGLFDPLGGYSEPAEYIPALARRASELGVEIREREKMTGFLIQGGRVGGVHTAAGAIEADAVVCTVHAWTLKVIEELRWQVPVKTFVHQRYVTAPLPAPTALPAVNANPLGGYVRPAHGGRLLLGIETADRAEYRVSSTDFDMASLSSPETLKERLKRDFTALVAALGEAAWESDHVGLIAFSMDGEPILGPVRQFPGLYIAGAFHSGGFAYNPVAGLLLAEFVADGRTSIDVQTFAPERFDDRATAAYLARAAVQADAVRRRH